jgi:DNA-directed RNA polymerase specialized sigma subunit
MTDARSTVQSIGTALEDRALRASLDVEAKRASLEASIEHRDGLVLELYDQGKPVREIARVMKLSASRVLQVVARRG